jgi:hypothetical protein
MLENPGAIDLEARYSWGLCRGTAPAVALEARIAGEEFTPAVGVLVHHRGNPVSCGGIPGSSPPVAACTISWDTEQRTYVAIPAETTEYRLRVGPLVSDTVTVRVSNARTEERCREPAVNVNDLRPRLEFRPERTQIVFGDRVRVRATVGYELCGRLVRPGSFQPGLQSRRRGATIPTAPAEDIVAGHRYANRLATSFLSLGRQRRPSIKSRISATTASTASSR